MKPLLICLLAVTWFCPVMADESVLITPRTRTDYTVRPIPDTQVIESAPMPQEPAKSAPVYMQQPTQPVIVLVPQPQATWSVAPQTQQTTGMTLIEQELRHRAWLHMNFQKRGIFFPRYVPRRKTDQALRLYWLLQLHDRPAQQMVIQQ